MSSVHQRTGALERVDRILNRGGDADDVLRDVVGVLGQLYPWVAIYFVEGDGLVLGPAHGTQRAAVAAFPISFQRTKVGELHVAAAGADADERAFLERVALLVSAHCLVAWDTRGVPWDEVS